MSDSAISSFMNITGCSDHARAKFFLESSNGDIDQAVISFFENGSDGADEVAAMEEAAPPSTAATPSDSQSRLGHVSLDPPARPSGSGKDGNEYYAGGAQSGLGIMTPSKPVDNEQLVKDLFKKAKESGAATEEERQPRKEDRFIGTGYRLGGDGVETGTVPGQAARPQPKDIKLRMWKTGFNIDDGPLRAYDDPANKQFLDEITQGQLPMELRALGTEVNVSMEDRRTDSYEENKPKPVFKTFTGSGNRLGASEDSPSTSSSVKPPPPTPTGDLKIDDSQPKTKIRVRLASGKQVVQEFNQSHTILDLRAFCAGGAGDKPFELRAGFPPKPITADDGQTLKDANLLNETIIQRCL